MESWGFNGARVFDGIRWKIIYKESIDFYSSVFSFLVFEVDRY